MAEIRFDEATKVYDDGTVALSALDLTVDDHSLLVLVGPSGCGKTTALRMVAGLEEITEGSISIGGRVVNDIPPKNRDIAMVFQNYALYPHMTVFENMAFGLKLRKVAKSEIGDRVRSASGVLALEELLSRKPKALSGGQRQRVAMGRAIVREPQAFLMDEPLSNLDAKLRVQMRTEILRLQRQLEVTMIYVTHDQVEAMTMGDKVAVLRLGVLQQVDPPQEMYRHPTNLFVAGFIGSPAMNLVEATIEDGDGSLSVRFGSRSLKLDAATLASRPILKSYEGKPVVLGIRPEDMEDAALVGASEEGSRMPVVVDLREDMGPELFIHFGVDAPPVLTEDTKELAEAQGEEALAELHQRRAERQSSFVARFSGRSHVREGDNVDIWVDNSALHFFDPTTGAAIAGG
jgi:multiple sugar transport system ATP-binding protein